MNKTDHAYVIGIDFGTDSCRTLLVDATTGEELASDVEFYPRWKKGLYCDPAINQYRQHPLDYMESMELAVRRTLSQCPEGTAEKVVGIAIDTTGSTPVLLDKSGMPLSLLPEYSDNPNAMFVLWKDHTAVKEAGEINDLSKRWETDFTAYSGSIYSAEWVWAKMLHLLRVDPSIRKSAYSWVEHCDWMPALLTGNILPENIRRSRCAAGHKAMWCEKWGGLPSSDFLTTLDPLLDIFKGHLYQSTYTSDACAGYLSEEWAVRLGLSIQVAVGVGALDCHMGAVGAGISEKTFVRVMGTSTCDVMVASYDEIKNSQISGICGQVDGSVIPGMVGLEAGQSAFGDVYAWFKDMLLWPLKNILPSVYNEEEAENIVRLLDRRILPSLTEEARKIPVSESIPVSVDWLNGRRTPDANQNVTGLISGLTLGTSAPLLFKSLVEATAFGSKSIVDCFLKQQVKIESITAIGGISLKSPFVMQTLANVLNMPIKVARSEQACALGAAMFAAVAAGVYSRIEEAQQIMGKGFATQYDPDEDIHHQYLPLYQKYLDLGHFIETRL